MARSKNVSSVKSARCPAAASLKIALKRAVRIAVEEFGIPGNVLSPHGENCSSVRESWEVVKKDLLSKCLSPRESRVGFRLRSTLKSCSRLFDVPCKPCDRKAARKAAEEWRGRVSTRPSHESTARCLSHLDLLRESVRELASGWGRKLKECRLEGGPPRLGEYVPDVQGCLEVSKGQGGTLAGALLPLGEPSLLRLGVAKTKGKHRVVTMQGARVKRVLTPIHNALYDHISSFGWCVRGDVTKEDFEAVLGDRRDGEDVISGDYQSATDNIYLPAVEAIVGVVAESPELTVEEKDVLVRSFSDLQCRLSVCPSSERFPILRGSMMGNLVSFPILCLLNKACIDIASQVAEGRRDCRVVRVNGDDCLFAGDARLWSAWRHVTGIFGLVVNEEKSGRSRRWLELNSQVYDAHRHSFVGKPVLSFLRTDRHAPGPILGDVVRGIRSFKLRVQLWIVKVLMRHEICVRGVTSSCADLGPFWRSALLPCRWFRAAAIIGPAPVKECGVDRDVPVRHGPVPIERVFGAVSRLSALVQRERTVEWSGRFVKPLVRTIDRVGLRNHTKARGLHRCSNRFSFGGWKWSFLWPVPVLEFFSEKYPGLLEGGGGSSWRTDHPFLTRVPVFLESPRPPPFSAVPCPSSLSFLDSFIKRI